MVIGTNSFWISRGSSERKKPDVIAGRARPLLEKETADLSKTAGAKVRKDRGLILQGASTDGDETQVCAALPLRRFGSNLGYPIDGFGRSRGAGSSKRRPARFASREVEKRDGW
jgi:hypothetical protein